MIKTSMNFPRKYALSCRSDPLVSTSLPGLYIVCSNCYLRTNVLSVIDSLWCYPFLFERKINICHQSTSRYTWCRISLSGVYKEVMISTVQYSIVYSIQYIYDWLFVLATCYRVTAQPTLFAREPITLPPSCLPRRTGLYICSSILIPHRLFIFTEIPLQCGLHYYADT